MIRFCRPLFCEGKFPSRDYVLCITTNLFQYLSLGDRSYDKRKIAAQELTNHIKALKDPATIDKIITILAQDFARSRNANHRKGGLIGLAATALGVLPVRSICPRDKLACLA
jgi:hypothetical protein